MSSIRHMESGVNNQPNNQPSPADCDTRGGLWSSAGRLMATWLGQTMLLYVSPIDVSRFPSKRAFPAALSAVILALFFAASLHDGVNPLFDAVLTALLAAMALASIRRQPKVRYTSAFASAMAIGFLVNEGLTIMGVNGVLLDLQSTWTLVTILRISLGVLSER